jgi:hypothetical protein
MESISADPVLSGSSTDSASVAKVTLGTTSYNVPAGVDPLHAAEVMDFLMKHTVDSKNKPFSKKKVRDIMQLSAPAFEAFKLNTVISECCKVSRS